MSSARAVRIAIRGQLGAHLASAFEGLRVESTGSRTVLVGQIADQAQLHGHLARIRDLGLELESVDTFVAVRVVARS